jgi:hypothetical protein
MLRSWRRVFTTAFALHGVLGTIVVETCIHFSLSSFCGVFDLLYRHLFVSDAWDYLLHLVHGPLGAGRHDAWHGWVGSFTLFRTRFSREYVGLSSLF